jgi:predicted amidohydrolase
VGVNRVGDDPTCHYNGGSCVIDPWGESIAVCEFGKEDVVTAEIDVDKLHDFRNKFPVLNDQDF